MPSVLLEGSNYRAKKRTPGSNKPVARWWLDENPHEGINHVCDSLAERQKGRIEQLLRCARLYGDMPMLGFGAYSYARSDTSARSLGRLSLNVVRNCADAVTAKITKSKVRPMFLTSDGDYALQQRAKKLQRLTEGMFYEHGVYNTTPKCFQDATVFGTGVVHIWREGDDIRTERVFQGELMVDDAEAVYGDPRSMYRQKFYDREVAKELWPDHAEAIENAPCASDAEEAVLVDTTSDLIRVREAWHLPSGKKAKDGKHAVCIEGHTLFSEKWEKDYFPFAMLRWGNPLLGFWGNGLADQLAGIQLEINKLLRQIQQAMHLGSTLKVFVEKGSRINTSQLLNEMGIIIEYTGTKPDYSAPQTVNPEVFAHLDRLYSRAYEICGISQLSAASQKPSGLNSGAALDSYSDIESERFIAIGRQWEEFHVEIARQQVALAREIPNFSVVSMGRKNIEAVKFSEADLSEDSYRMQVFPASALPRTPAGRLNMINNLLQMQLIEPQEAKRQLDFPELDDYMSRADAWIDEVLDELCDMRDNGEPHVPDAVVNYDEAIRLASGFYLESKRKGVPEDRLDLIRDYLADLADMKTQSQPPPAPAMPGPTDPMMGPAGPMPPPGGPMAPPPGAPPPMSPEAMRQAA